MSPSPAKRSLGPLLPAIGWMIAIGSVVLHSYATYRIPIETARKNTPVIRLPYETAPLSDSTGYPVPCYYTDFDGYYYVSFARQMVEQGALRVRWTHLDNAPNGRAVHWSSLFSWWLVGLGALHSLISSYDISTAICAAGYYANPLLFGIALTMLCWIVWRRIGSVASILLLVTLSTHRQVSWDFSYARPDHHGLHLVFAMGVVLCVILGGGGWVGSRSSTPDTWPKMPQARRWMIASGVLGGCGLWTGATQFSVVILSLGIGAVLSMWFGAAPETRDDLRMHQDRTPPQYDPALWRWWSWAGAATSLLAYLIEYLPNHFSMRLEVNNPLYAMAWLCGGEVLYRYGRWKRSRTPVSALSIFQSVLLLMGAVSVYALIVWGPEGWFLVRDPYMLRLHEKIEEFQPFTNSLARFSFSILLSMIGVVSVVSIISVAAMATRQWRRADRAFMLLTLTPTLMLMGCTLYQMRWLGFLTVVGSCQLLTLLRAKSHAPCKKSIARIAATALMFAVVGFQGAIHVRDSRRRIEAAPAAQGLTPLLADIHMRDLGMRIVSAANGRSLTVMSSPWVNCRMHFFAPCLGIGTLFWENVEGIRATVDFFADYGDADARRIAMQHNIDFVIVPFSASSSFPASMHGVKYGNAETEQVQRTLAYRLGKGKSLPRWLVPVSLVGTPEDGYWRMYRVGPLGDG